MTAYITRTTINQIMRHAMSRPGQEVCGLVGSSAGHTRVYPIQNIARQNECRYIMDPQQQIAAMRQMREAGESLFAIYHSHPHAPAVPSALDIAEAAYPEALYLIVSLDTEGVVDVRGYQLQGQEMQSLELEMIND